MEARDLRQMTVEEYLILDRASESRWEYVNGEAYAMSGGTLGHNLIKLNVAAALKSALQGGPCLTFPDGQKVATPRTLAYHYPDALVICGPPERDAKDELAVVNPTLLVEVSSPSSADYDRGAKFDHYATLPSLREYLIVLIEPRVVHLWQKVAPSKWLRTELHEGEIELASVAARLLFADVYADLERVKP